MSASGWVWLRGVCSVARDGFSWGFGRGALGVRLPLRLHQQGQDNKNELIWISPFQSLGSQFLSFPPSPLRCDRCYFVSRFSSPMWVTWRPELELSRGGLGEAHPSHVPNAFPCTWHLSRSFTSPYPVPFPSPRASLPLSFPTCSPPEYPRALFSARGHHIAQGELVGAGPFPAQGFGCSERLPLGFIPNS